MNFNTFALSLKDDNWIYNSKPSTYKDEFNYSRNDYINTFKDDLSKYAPIIDETLKKYEEYHRFD